MSNITDAYANTAGVELDQPLKPTKRTRGTRREASELQKRYDFESKSKQRQRQVKQRNDCIEEQKLVNLWRTVRSNGIQARENADHEGHLACNPCIELCEECSMPVLKSMLKAHMADHSNKANKKEIQTDTVVVTADMLQTMAKDLEAVQLHQQQVCKNV